MISLSYVEIDLGAVLSISVYSYISLYPFCCTGVCHILLSMLIHMPLQDVHVLWYLVSYHSQRVVPACQYQLYMKEFDLRAKSH